MDKKQKPVAGWPEGVRSDHFLVFEDLQVKPKGPVSPTARQPRLGNSCRWFWHHGGPGSHQPSSLPSGGTLGKGTSQQCHPAGGLPEPELAVLTGDGGASVPARKAPVTDPHP